MDLVCHDTWDTSGVLHSHLTPNLGTIVPPAKPSKTPRCRERDTTPKENTKETEKIYRETAKVS